MATVTAQIASQSLKGQDVIVHLDSSDTINVLPTIEVGQVCTNGSSSYTGNVSSVDYYGSSFKLHQQCLMIILVHQVHQAY